MNQNLYFILQRSWTRHLDASALIVPNRPTLGYRDLDILSARFAAVLAARGVAPGDRVVVQIEKSIEAIALYLACLRSGAIYVPVNPAYTPAEVAYFRNDAEPALFVSGGEMAALIAQAAASAPLHDIAQDNSDDIAAILYTSGTTGRSKGAMLTHGNLASNAAALAALWGVTADDVLIHALPVFHVHGLFIALNTMFVAGASTLFLPKFDAAEVCAAMAQATMMMGVPTFYTRLLGDPDFGEEARGMRLFTSGSAPLLAETHREFAARTGHHILERYGMTETGIITSNPLNGDRRAGTVGYALPWVEVRIGAGDVIEVRGPNVFKGYWRMPEKTAGEFRDGGWFVTGDVGTLAADGRVTIAGRARDLIIAGGYNIYPSEIEGVIDAVPGVIESAVIGAPHPDLGEGVVAVIVGDAKAEAVQAAIAGQLARFKHPRRFEFVDELPRNAMGKVQKNVLRQTYAASFT